MSGCRTHLGKRVEFDSSKAVQELGIKFIDPEATMLDEARRLMDLGMV